MWLPAASATLWLLSGPGRCFLAFSSASTVAKIKVDPNSNTMMIRVEMKVVSHHCPEYLAELKLTGMYICLFLPRRWSTKGWNGGDLGSSFLSWGWQQGGTRFDRCIWEVCWSGLNVPTDTFDDWFFEWLKIIVSYSGSAQQSPHHLIIIINSKHTH